MYMYMCIYTLICILYMYVCLHFCILATVMTARIKIELISDDETLINSIFILKHSII